MPQNVKRLSLTVPESTYRKWEAKAKMGGYSMAELIRLAVAHFG